MTTQQRASVWIGFFVVFVLALTLLRDVLFPFVAGFAIAYFLDPVCDRLEKAGLSRTWSTVVVTAVFFVLFVLALGLLAPLLYSQLVRFIQRVPGYIDAIEQKAAPLIDFARVYFESGEGTQKVTKFLGENLGGVANFILKLFGNIAGGVEITLNLLSLFVITPIVAFYLLRDWDEIVARIDSWLPRHHADTIRTQAGLVDETLAGFVRGQSTVCLLLGLFYGIGLSLVGLDFGLIIGLGTGIVSFVPYFGMLIGFVVGMGLAIAQFNAVAPVALVAAVFVVGQLIEGNFLTPKLVGDRVNLHAVWIIFALMAGGALFGFVGILLAIPITAVIGVLIRFTLSHYLQSVMYHGGVPAPPPPSDEGS